MAGSDLMSKSEQKLADVTGSSRRSSATGASCRIRTGRTAGSSLEQADGDRRQRGKETVPLSKIQSIRGRYDVNQAIAKVSNYISINYGQNVYLISMEEVDTFELELQKAILDGEIVLIKHPAVKGGVVQDLVAEGSRQDQPGSRELRGRGRQTGPDRGRRRRYRRERRADGPLERAAGDRSRAHGGGLSVQTYLGSPQNCAILKSVLDRGRRKRLADRSLGKEEEVLMAIYSGVSPFEVPEFSTWISTESRRSTSG